MKNLILFLLPLLSSPILSQSSVNKTSSAEIKITDEQLVKEAILDYVEGIYKADSARILQSVHPELRKRGYSFNKKEKVYKVRDMSYDELARLSAIWNKSGDRANEESPKKIEIYEVNDKTASGKLTAVWGIDYFHLAKLEGKWFIMNVLWQSMK